MEAGVEIQMEMEMEMAMEAPLAGHLKPPHDHRWRAPSERLYRSGEGSSSR